MIATLAAAAALLLLVSGAAKLREPGAAATMLLGLLRRPARERQRMTILTYAVAMGEVTLGATVVVVGSPIMMTLLAVVYLAFAAVALELQRPGRTRASCGCFGNAGGPAGPGHLVLTAVGAAVALAAAVRPPGLGVGLFDDGPLVAVVRIAQAALLAALGFLAVTSLPAMLAARRQLAASGLSSRAARSGEA